MHSRGVKVVDHVVTDVVVLVGVRVRESVFTLRVGGRGREVFGSGGRNASIVAGSTVELRDLSSRLKSSGTSTGSKSCVVAGSTTADALVPSGLVHSGVSSDGDSY